MASEQSKITVYAAIAGNAAIAVTKFVAAALTGSSAMLSEGIHSTVDTGNGLLLLLGIRLSKRPPDRTHPFGYGAELYFWSLIVAVLIFGAGGGISAYEGVLHLIHPSEVKDPMMNIGAILAGVALVLIYETRGLLIGESASPETVETIQNIAADDQAVDRAGVPLTLHLGSDQIMVALELQFCLDQSVGHVTAAIERIETQIRNADPRVRQIFIEPRTSVDVDSSL